MFSAPECTHNRAYTRYDGIEMARASKGSAQRIQSHMPTRSARRLTANQVVDRATEVIGDRNEALRWVGTPVRALGYATPISLLGTREGSQQVLAVLDRLEHGVL